jgi:cell division protein FtsQ
MTSDRPLGQILKTIWQTLALSGLLAGTIWAMTRPSWVLRANRQVAIEGNSLLSKQVILSRLSLEYPRSLLQISPLAIAETLESYPPIADARVVRRLFPPSLVVQVQERTPVAVAIARLVPGSSTPHSQASIGFLDPQGTWIPLQSYPAAVRQRLNPNLKVLGSPESYRPYWDSLYQAVSQSAVKIVEIDCQDPANLVLKTELGIVYLGSYSAKLTKQLEVLAQMRSISTQVNASQIAYIDLKNPANPLVQMYQSKDDKTSVRTMPVNPKIIKSNLQ